MNTPLNATYRERGLLFTESDTMVVSDLHLGRTDAENLQFPTPEYDDILDRFEAMLDSLTPRTVVLAGDVFQRFEEAPMEAVETAERLGELVIDYGGEMVVTPGNHDTYKFDRGMRNVAVVSDEYEIEEGVILHGHERPTTDADLYVVGHLHPVVKHRGSKWPCFLYGQNVYNGGDVLVLPAFADTVGGVNVPALSPPLGLDMPVVDGGEWLGAYHPLIYDDTEEDVRVFPRIDQFDD